MTEKEWLGENQLSLDIWHKKYQINEESFENWLDRISNGNNDVKNLIRSKKFLFGGRILASRGVTDRRVTYSNCYVITPPEDNIESIFTTASKLARTYSYGGGCGVDISNLRPKDAIVHNAAKSTSGAVSFMDLYSYVTGLIGQSGRRGALMISIDCHHPDIEEFINLKTKPGVCEKANISIRVTDDFMRAAINNEDWVASYTSEETGTITRTFKAQELLKLLAKRNWEWAEPGLLYWDRISNYNMLDNTDFKYAGVNPCLTGDSLIQTVEGEISIKDLVGSTPFVYCMDSNGNLAIRRAVKIWKTRENAQLVEVITGKGRLICTPDHRIFTTNRGWVEAINLQKGDKIKGLNRQTTGHKYCSVGLSGTKYEKEHRFIARHFYDIEDMDVHHINDDGFDNRLSNLEVITHEEHSKLSNTGRAIGVNRDETTGRYLPKEEHTGRTCRNLGKEVGVNWYVQEVRTLDYTEDVYDMTVEDTHNFIANGFVVHNCAEEPLPAGGSCLLGSINLSEFVINPFTENAYIDYEALQEAVYVSVVGLNQVLDEGMYLHPLQEQRDSVGDWRQIGLGTMGLADMLIKLGVVYGSNKALRVTEEVFKCIAVASVEMSLQLAKEHGCYRKCDKEKLAESSFIRALNLPKAVLEDIRKYGLYNSQLLTCAPTGSIATMLQTSTGVEPNFALKYLRKTQTLNGKDTFYEVNAKIVDDYKKVTDNDLTDAFIESKDIAPIARIAMQSVLQKYTDASISSTINLPKEATVDEVYDIYVEAWKQGLKGVTVYRTGCYREGILVTKKPDEIPMTSAPKRPVSLPCDIHKIKVKGEHFIVCVGLLNKIPYEVFVFRLVNDIALTENTGTITKKSKGIYSLKSKDMEIANLLNTNISIEEKAATLYSSMLLRHGINIKYIIKTSKKVNYNISSFSSAMCRVLAKYIPAETGGKCPECGEPLVHEGGCIHCSSCSYSKCE